MTDWLTSGYRIPVGQVNTEEEWKIEVDVRMLLMRRNANFGGECHAAKR
jgi:hypothetical protein